MKKTLSNCPGRSNGKKFTLLLTAILWNLIFLINTAAAAPERPSISSPLPSDSYEGGVYINFAGNCIENVNGVDVELSGAALVWESSKDGVLGTGQSLSINTLQSGIHTITLIATNSESSSNTTSIEINVSNNKPTSIITSPSNGCSFNATNPVTFSGTGTDRDSADTLSYLWTSTTNNTTSEVGTSPTIVVSTLAVGTHVIILTVDDGQDAIQSDSITITITNNPPVATIVNPGNNDTFYSETTINFDGTGTDSEDDSETLKYNWSCSKHGKLSSEPSFSTSTLVDGDHTITFTVTDTHGATNTVPQSITIHVGNHNPVTTITEPSNGTSYDINDIIVFKGSASDAEDGTLSGSSLVWSSNIDGDIGTGNTLPLDSLANGTHIITLTATDNFSTPGTGTDSIIITISNSFPTAIIYNPSDNSSFYENTDITFSGAGTDAEDGELSEASLVWKSSLDGKIGTGSPLIANTLSTGTHSITLTATDSESASTTTAPITVIIGNNTPIANITAPADGSSFNRGETITFKGTANDSEDGFLTGASLTWSSDISGELGIGTSLPVNTLTTGTHTITLTASDSQAATSSESIAVTINNSAPVVTISSPLNNSSYDIETSISFTGIASDLEDGYISGESLCWESSNDGILGTGTSISATLTKGMHIVTLTATDSENDEGFATLTVYVGNNPPIVSITSPSNESNYDVGEYIRFHGTASDPEDGTLSGSSIVWTSSINGEFAEGLNPDQINNLSTGQHRITLVATDSNNAITHSSPITIRIGNAAPVATIISPTDNQSFESGEIITFQGTGTDPEDASDALGYSWSGSEHGLLNSSSSFTSGSLETGSHTITFTVSDTHGASNTVPQTITIYIGNTNPVATITAPSNNASYDMDDIIVFKGSASDTEDGALSGPSLVWSSNIDGDIGVGDSVTSGSLTSGAHIISLTATDSHSTPGTGIDSIVITINNNSPTAAISRPFDNNSFYENTDIIFSGAGTDAEDGELSGDSLIWKSNLDGNIGTGSPLTINSLSSGTHSITLTATDSESASATTPPITIIIGNSPPVADITEPYDGSSFNQGETITFKGTANDSEDGILTGSSLIWSSNISGEIGIGTNLPINSLATGTHTITLTASDSQSAIGSKSITVAINNSPPVVTINSPLNNSSYDIETSISFTGIASDPEDGFISGESLNWVSSNDGLLGTGTSISATLTKGVHIVILTASDRENNKGLARITVHVGNNPPIVSITSPAIGSNYDVGEYIRFHGTASDPEDGTLFGSSLVWTSSINGKFAEGLNPDQINTLTNGQHKITLVATDSNNTVTYSAPITIRVGNTAPLAIIISPANNTSFESGETITFEGKGIDNKDASESLIYEWSSNEQGLLSSSSSFNESSLKTGNHTITFTVTDTHGTPNSVPQSINIHVGNNNPVATITEPSEGTSYDAGDIIIFKGTASDIENGTLSGASLVWSSNINGIIGTGNIVKSDSLANGTHIITLTASDNHTTTGTGNDSIAIAINNTFPTAIIHNPSNQSSFYENENVIFSGTGTDAEDGELSENSLVWTSSLDGNIGTGSSLATDSLSPGTHSITLKANDSESASTTSTPITITIGNALPTADITAPADGSSYMRGETITFKGAGTDTEDGNLTDVSLSWSSSIAGIIGTGTILPINTLTTGTHAITLTAIDSQSAIGSQAIVVTINNSLPDVTISSPLNNSIYETETLISFTGTALDVEDGFITEDSLEWASSNDGILGTGTSISTILSKGMHIITLRATDSDKDTKTATLTVHVGNNPPIVSITSPATGSNYDTGEYITFKGTATDKEDGTLSGSSLKWTSSIDGNFAEGLNPDQINTLSTGRHNIALIATDSNGALTYSTPMTIRIGNTLPVATIISPADNTSFEKEATITFEGTGIDQEDGILLSTALEWTSSRQGKIGTGTSFSTSGLEAGQHTITLIATDLNGSTHSSSITIIAQNTKPAVSIDTPISGTSVDVGNNIVFEGTATDREDGTLAENALEWISDIDGSLGTGSVIVIDSLSGGTHIITLTATDNTGLKNSATITITIIPMILSTNTLSLEKGETGIITVIGGTKPYRVATRRGQIAMPTENNGFIFILGISEGSTVITVTDHKKHSAEVYVTITDNSDIQDPNDDPANQLPDADAGPDQSEIYENEQVYLTGSNANTKSSENPTFLWIQTDPINPATALAEPTVKLSDDSSPRPSFIAPLIGLNGGPNLAFKLTVINQNGLVDTDTIIIRIKDNGITEYPDDTTTFKSKTNKNMAAKISGNGELKRLTALDPYDINTSALPQNLIYGLIDMKIKTLSPGETIALVVYLPAAAPEGYDWYKYIKAEDIWVNFDRELISSGEGDGAVFNSDRTTVTLYITDGGEYDDNDFPCIIEDPSGLGTYSSEQPSNNDDSGSGGGGGGGCFLNSAGYFK